MSTRLDGVAPSALHRRAVLSGPKVPSRYERNSELRRNQRAPACISPPRNKMLRGGRKARRFAICGEDFWSCRQLRCRSAPRQARPRSETPAQAVPGSARTARARLLYQEVTTDSVGTEAVPPARTRAEICRKCELLMPTRRIQRASAPSPSLRRDPAAGSGLRPVRPFTGSPVFAVVGWPREIALPGLPHIRTCALRASGSRSRRTRRGLPGSWGTLALMPCSQTPVEPTRPDP